MMIDRQNQYIQTVSNGFRGTGKNKSIYSDLRCFRYFSAASQCVGVIMEIQSVTRADLEALHCLVLSVSKSDILPLFSSQGRIEFKSRILSDLETTLDELSYASIKATKDGKLVGFGSLRNGNYLTHLFVSTAAQGIGLGSRLLHILLSLSDANQVTLRSSPNAVGFYSRNGFKATGEESETNGIRFVPMALMRT